MSDELGIIQLDTNLSDIDRPPEIPVGRYVGEIQAVEVKTSAAGNEYFAIRILIPGENIPAEVAEHYEDGALFFWNRMLVPKGNDRRSLWNLRQFIEKIGLNSNTNEINPNEWMNQTVGVVIGMSKNLEGELRSEIKSLFAAEDVPARHEEEEVEAEEAKPVSITPAARGRRRG